MLNISVPTNNTTMSTNNDNNETHLKWVAVKYDESFFKDCKAGSEARMKFDQIKSANITNKKDWHDLAKAIGARPLDKKKSARRIPGKNPPTYWRANLSRHYRISLCPDFAAGELVTHVFSSGDRGHKNPGKFGQPGYWRVIHNFRTRERR